ncbi:MAG: hypothetical protein U5K74_02565 [Gemmatimonadaceae bacterium]|nr:hypothetical protein [Gemmatimonadaceae bacterium]
MPAIVRPSGISVDASGGATVEGTVALRRRRTGQLPPRGAGTPGGGGRRRRNAPPTAAPLTEEEALINAIEDQELELVDAIPLGRAPVAPARRRRTRTGTAPVEPPSPATVALDIPLAEGESAVVLLEQNGVYEWHVTGAVVDTPVAPAPPPPSRRRRTAARPGSQPVAAAPAKTMRFTLTLAPEPVGVDGAAARPSHRRRRGIVTKFLFGRAIAYVFRFIAKPIVAGLARFQERNVREGLVHVTTADPSRWLPLAENDMVALPTDRAARVLLLVHGTFSSTVGSFGALAGHADGAAFLASALASYDLIVGWDHKTLSATPTDNAVDLITRLDRLGFAIPPTVDAIAFSRGGLVLRSLIEEILPNHPGAFRVRRAVFVACANDGTHLANPRHWNRFVDRYTNLAAAGARIVSLVPTFTHGAMIFSEAVRGLGAFVKALVGAAKTGEVVPGLEAMDPDGTYVHFINQVQPGQPVPEDTYYCAITSDFDPGIASRTLDPEVLPPRVLLSVGDTVADALFGEPNDLVVHVASMTHIDPGAGQFVRDRHDFGTNGHVFHTVYFHQPETAQALTRWFGVSTASPDGACGHAALDATSRSGRPRASGEAAGWQHDSSRGRRPPADTAHGRLGGTAARTRAPQHHAHDRRIAARDRCLRAVDRGRTLGARP